MKKTKERPLVSEETAPRMRSMRMNYRADDKTIVEFIEAQEAKSVSLRLLITLFMREHGAQDVTTVVSQVLGGHDSANNHDRVTTAEIPEDTAAEADTTDKDAAANTSVQDTPDPSTAEDDLTGDVDKSALKSESAGSESAQPKSTQSESPQPKSDAPKKSESGKKPDISEMFK